MLNKTGQRRKRRVKAEIEADYTLNNIHADCLILDISEEGMGIKSHQILLPGDILHLTFELGKFGEIAVVLLVRYMRGTRVGCRFLDMDDISRSSIRKFINQS